MTVDVIGGESVNFSQSFSCPDCGISIDEVEPRSFSFNNPFGACPECFGLGYKMEFDEDLMIPDKSLSINEGAIVVLGWQSCAKPGSFSRAILDALAAEYHFDLDTPFKDYPKEIHDILIYGTGGKEVKVHYTGQRGTGVYDVAFEGLIENVNRRYRETFSQASKAEYESFMRITPCTTCHGQRLKQSSLAVTVGGLNIYEATNMSIVKFREFIDDLKLSEMQKMIGEQILKEIRARISFLIDVGLDYLSLSRATGTLSGGEAQRIRLATQIGSGLVGVAYILDEPSIGLHQRDNDKLLKTLEHLRDLGNSVIVVEHDEDTMRAADCIVDIGPGAGEHGGNVVAVGTAAQIMKCKESITGAYLSGRIKIPVPKERRSPTGWIKIRGARENNLKNITVDIPLKIMTAITGVSGSGKSTLIKTILVPALKKLYGDYSDRTGSFDKLTGDLKAITGVEFIDQNPIGKSTRSNPVTYLKAWDDIRKIFSDTQAAKVQGFKPAHFSFNVPGGRCEECQGEGIIKVEMQFMADVFLECEHCKGRRFKDEVLEISYKGKNIYDILEMTVNQALEFFSAGNGHSERSIVDKLQKLVDVGLGYVKLGQSSSTLSGGESQRVKLAYHLSRENADPTLFVFDEPTTGLHFHDIHKLMSSLNALIERGHSVLIIEHNMDVIKCADYVIDLGPEGGKEGGRIVCTGTPEQVVKCPESYTGHYLKEKLQ